ncbi:hypothetical protein NQZ68_005796 [Dissostichus eleginoides]|nr:hypothetical protein NQZ68_005796 [Dissostichus eleginoides]
MFTVSPIKAGNSRRQLGSKQWGGGGALASFMPKSPVECQAHYRRMRVDFSSNSAHFTGDNEPLDHWDQETI